MGAVNLFYFLLFLLFFVVFAWHGYKEQEEEQNNSIDKGKPKHCHSYAEATKPPSKEEYDKMKLWSAMRNFNNSNEKSESLYGFKHSIEAIWKHQFPEDCSNKKFLISGGWPYGFGSRIHMEGIGLAIAMQMGRIYLHHPDGDNIFWVCSLYVYVLCFHLHP